MKLVSVNRSKDAPQVLWEMMRTRLQEDRKGYNISHRKMPSWKQHLAFIKSRRNGHWYMIRKPWCYVGWVYLNDRDEIGLMIFPAQRGFGAGTWALKEIRRRHKRRRYLANINPKNKRSIEFFKRAGFKDQIQITLEKRA